MTTNISSKGLNRTPARPAAAKIRPVTPEHTPEHTPEPRRARHTDAYRRSVSPGCVFMVNEAAADFNAVFAQLLNDEKSPDRIYHVEEAQPVALCHALKPYVDAVVAADSTRS